VKRDALHVFVGCFVGGLALPSAAQQNSSPSPPPVVQTPPTNPASAAPQVNDEASKPAAPKKTCEPVLIRAGPNQGQLVSKCHHTDRSKDRQS